MKETIVKIKKTKSWFFKKINKTDKSLARLIKEKRKEMKETIVKIKKTKSGFFKKINKTDKSLARLIKEKREKTQISKIRNEKGEVTTDNEEIKRL